MDGWLLINKPIGISSMDVLRTVKRVLITQYKSDFADSLDILASEDFAKNGDINQIDKMQVDIPIFDKNIQMSHLSSISEVPNRDLKKKYHMRRMKIGNVGVLDPMACGLLVIAIGKANKLIDFVHTYFPKTYLFSINWGVETTTDDVEGDVVNKSENCLIDENIKDIFADFKGNILQIPPLFSSVKVNGIRAYDMARQNYVFSLKKKQVNVFDIGFLSDFLKNYDATQYVQCIKSISIFSNAFHCGMKKKINDHDNNIKCDSSQRMMKNNVDAVSSENMLFHGNCNTKSNLMMNMQLGIAKLINGISHDRDAFFIQCSSGTYVRSVCRDFGRKLNTFAHANSIFRIKIGDFDITSALDFDILPQIDVNNFILPVEFAIPDDMIIRINSDQMKRIVHGNVILFDNIEDLSCVFCFFNDKIVAQCVVANGVVTPVKVFC